MLMNEMEFNQEGLVRFLGNTALFHSADPAVLSLLAGKTKVSSFDGNEAIIHKGEEGSSMYLILSGQLKVHDGAEVVARLKSGEIFGEISLLDSEPRSMSVTTLEPTILGSIHSEDFYEVLKKFPDIIKDIIAVLSKRLRNQNQVLISEYRTRESQLKELVDKRTAEVMQQKKELEVKNLLIAEKNKEMTDSLNYASRLQTAILPKREEVRQLLRDSFILFQPKDIVSGDFYCLEKVGDKIILAAADCTGHGVAGAIMSMIGTSLLKQMILEKSITDPAEILSGLNAGVVEALHQAKSQANDGMDVALCAFDFGRLELAYAGANRPLWLIRNGELTVISPDKFPVGGMQINHGGRFARQLVKLQKNDAVYLFSDGYADQFGGPMGKKLMTKKMKELLLSICSQPMEEQGDYLGQYIIDWMGHVEQTDDIMVIGVKV